MIRSRAGLVLAIVGCLAVWGCSQESGPTATSDNSGKTGKLQEEIKTLTSARDALKDDLKAAKSASDQLEAEVARLRETAKQRDELARMVAARTTERDAAVGQLETIKKGVRALIEIVEPAPSPTSQPPVGNHETKPNGNS